MPVAVPLVNTLNPYNWQLVPSMAVPAVQDAKAPQAHKPAARRPHMERCDGETDAEWNARLSRSCYWCGCEYESAGPELNAHEDSHTAN